MDQKYFYVAVRRDLPMPQQLCQAVHAAHEAGIRYGDPSRISSVVILSVPDEPELRKLKHRLDLRGIQSYMFEEDDIGDQATALATEPVNGKARNVLSSYPLWR